MIRGSADNLATTVFNTAEVSIPTLQKYLTPYFEPSFQAALGEGEKGDGFRLELDSLSQEENPKILFENLYSFALQLENHDRLEAAQVIYQNLIDLDAAKTQISLKTQEKANYRLDAILGRGDTGARMAFLAQRIPTESLSLTTIVGMTAAGTLGKLAYARFFGDLMESPAILKWVGRFGTNALAGAGSLALEAPAFTVMVKGMNQALGDHSSWAWEELQKELFAGLLFLGPMKISNFLGELPFAQMRRSGVELTGITKWSEKIFPQASTLAGIVSAKLAQRHYGLSPDLKDDTLILDSVGSLFEFQTAGLLSHHLLGETHQRWIKKIELSSQAGTTQLLPEWLSSPLRKSMSFQLVTPEGLLAMPPNFFMTGDGGKHRPPSDPPERISSVPPSDPFGRELVKLAAANELGEESIPLLKYFAQRIQYELQQVLAEKPTSVLARKIAAGEEVVVTVWKPEENKRDPDPLDYNLTLSLKKKPSAKRDNYQVQLVVNTRNGSVKPGEMGNLAHDRWELNERSKGNDVSLHWIPLYHKLVFSWDELRHDRLIDVLSPASHELATMDQTLMRLPPSAPPPPLPKEEGPIATNPTIRVKQEDLLFDAEQWARHYESAEIRLSTMLDIMQFSGRLPMERRATERKIAENFMQQVLKHLAKLMREGNPKKISSSGSFDIWVRPQFGKLKVQGVSTYGDSPAFLKEPRNTIWRRMYYGLFGHSELALVRLLPMQDEFSHPLQRGVYLQQINIDSTPNAAELKLRKIISIGEPAGLLLPTLSIPATSLSK